MLLAVACSVLASRVLPRNENVALGFPSIGQPGRTRLLVRGGFTLLHDDVRKEPLWVEFRLRKDYVSAKGREDKFKPDPDIPSGSRAEMDDYAHSGFDRGHMASSADMRRTEHIQAESFYLSNMAPQNPALNRGIWSRLEALFRKYAVEHGNVYIAVGPIFDKPLPAGMPPLPTSIGTNKVEVPTWFYRIVFRRLPGGHWGALAFEFPNVKVPAGDDLRKYLVSVDRVESDTRLNFANALPTAEQARFEGQSAVALW